MPPKSNKSNNTKSAPERKVLGDITNAKKDYTTLASMKKVSKDECKPMIYENEDVNEDDLTPRERYLWKVWKLDTERIGHLRTQFYRRKIMSAWEST